MTYSPLSEQLYVEILTTKKLHLNPVQEGKFRYACEKAILENPGAGFDDLLIACRIYLNFIVDWPDLDLGPVKFP
jgi:hypothetical protein